MDINVLIKRFGSRQMLNRKVLIAEVVLLLYGIFLLVFPATGMVLSVAAVGVILILAGLFCGVWFFFHRDDGNYPIAVLAVVGIAAGILAFIFRANIALVLFPVLLGVWSLFTAICAFLSALGYYRRRNALWWVPLLAAVVALVVTVMIFVNLSGTERFMARLLGLYFITYNIVRLGEFAALKMDFGPAAAPARKPQPSGRVKVKKQPPRKKVYTERENNNEYETEEVDLGYDEYDDYADSYSGRSRGYKEIDDLDDDEDYRAYRRSRGYDD